MNDDSSALNQNTNPAVSTNRIQPQAPQVPVQPVAPVAPVGGVNKETGPIGPAPVSEFVRPSGAEITPNISPEVSGHIKVNNEAPNLTPEHKGLVSHAGPNIAAPSFPAGKVSLPMSEEEVAEQFKTGQDDDSEKWLAGLVKKILAWGLKPR